MRRNLLAVGAVLLLGLAVLTAAVAFDGPATDDTGSVSLAPHDGPNGQYASVEDGELTVELDSLNAEAQTTVDDVFTITATGDEARYFAVSHDADAVTVYRDGDPAKPLEGRTNAVMLSPGETLSVGVAADTHGRDSVLMDLISIVSWSADERNETERNDRMDERDGTEAGDEADGENARVSIDVRIDRTEITAGESANLTAVVSNDGDSDAEAPVRLLVDGVVVDERRVLVQSGENRTVTFTREFQRAGEYAVSVNDGEPNTVTVSPAAGPAPRFSVTNASVSDDALAPGDEMSVTATVANDGSADGTFVAELEVDGVVVATRRVAVPAGATRTVTFANPVERAGTFGVSVSGTDAGTVTATTSDEAPFGDLMRYPGSVFAVVPPLVFGVVFVRFRRQ
jgi:hypothetical protein